jgi:hypothetical protein
MSIFLKSRIEYWWKNEFFISVTYYKIKSKLRVWWDNKYNGPNEFHHSYNMDIEAVLHMKEKQRDKYYKNLYKRRQAAHDKDSWV